MHIEGRGRLECACKCLCENGEDREEEMATGDVRGNLERLKLQLRSISYPHALDSQG